jgi:ferric-dicitrate binding protein FerR (iron transport regulator)
MNGDAVATGNKGTAHLNIAGSALVAASNTTFTLTAVGDTAQVRLASGQVKETGDVPVVLANRQVVPVGGSASFSVTELNSRVYLSVTRGDVNVLYSDKALTVHAGRALLFDDQPAPAPGAGSGSWVAQNLDLIAVFGTLGILVGTYYGIVNSHSTTSPAS